MESEPKDPTSENINTLANKLNDVTEEIGHLGTEEIKTLKGKIDLNTKSLLLDLLKEDTDRSDRGNRNIESTETLPKLGCAVNKNDEIILIPNSSKPMLLAVIKGEGADININENYLYADYVSDLITPYFEGFDGPGRYKNIKPAAAKWYKYNNQGKIISKGKVERVD